MMAPLKILVVGAGAIGALFGVRLVEAGNAVTLVGRERLREAVARDGLTLVTDGAATTTHAVAVVTSTAAAFAGTQAYDWIFLTTKAYSLPQAARELAEATRGVMGQPLRVVTIQNGVGSEEAASEILGVESIVPATLTIPVEAESGARFSTRSKGGIGLARWTDHSPDPAPLADVLRKAGFRVACYPDWRAMKWSKLLLNMIGNATSAILGWPPDRTMSDPRLYRIEAEALHEARRVMRALGVATVNLPGYPARAQFAALERLPRWLTRPVMQKMVVGGRGGKMPSLYLGLEAGYRDSEVDVLNGAVVRAGEAAGVTTPTNRVLTKLVQALAQGTRSRAEFHHNPDALLAEIGRERRGISTS